MKVIDSTVKKNFTEKHTLGSKHMVQEYNHLLGSLILHSSLIMKLSVHRLVKL